MSESSEAARQLYKPSAVRVLFIGESPPSGGTFFYCGNSKLFRETARAFREAIPNLRGDDFRDSFRRLGCYLDDLCLEPVNQLKKGGSVEKALLAQARQAGEGPLADRIGHATPRAFVLIGLGIEPNVRRAVRQAGQVGLPFYPLPFPNWARDVTRFHDGLIEALCELRESLGSPDA